ncbi:MAG: hypothetical protein IPN71_16925 [Fibrobacteres bacterium]|nr:hypothetical protein [Fibrobacterota bacterium]
MRDALQTVLDKTHFKDPLHEAYRLALRSKCSPRARTLSSRDLDTLSAKDLTSDARWMLSRAWLRAGNKTRAQQEAKKPRRMVDSAPWRWGMGSSVRDRALALETMTELGDVLAPTVLCLGCRRIWPPPAGPPPMNWERNFAPWQRRWVPALARGGIPVCSSAGEAFA